MKTIKIFDYFYEYDAFLPTKEYNEIASYLGLAEWTPVVWICRLIGMDNDYAEHIFDNWDERELLEKKYEIDADEYLIVNPDVFKDGKNGPCNTPEIRKKFWTDVFKSLELSLDLIFEKARQNNEKETSEDFKIQNLEERIKKIRDKYL